MNFAETGHTPPGTSDAIAEVTSSRSKHFNSQDLTSTFKVILCLGITVWASGMVSHVIADLHNAISEVTGAAIGCVTDFDSQELANTVWVWAFVTHGRTLPALFEAITEEVTSYLMEFQFRNLTNTNWAFAARGQTLLALFDEIAEVVPSYSTTFQSQSLANTTWAFATVGCASSFLADATLEEGHTLPVLLDAFSEVAPSRVINSGSKDFNSKHLAHIGWAVTNAGQASSVPLDTFAEVAPSCSKITGLKHFHYQHLAYTPWAYAQAGHASSVLSNALAEVAPSRLMNSGVQNFNSQHLAHTAWASFGLFDAIAVATSYCEDAAPRILANTVWAFATRGRVAMTPFGKLSEQDFSSPGLANTAWAIAHQV